jgi:biotin operon repressor
MKDIQSLDADIYFADGEFHSGEQLGERWE